MTIQTFAAGQTLTATQMNTLQASDFNFTRNVQTGASYTLVETDKGKLLEFSNAGSINLTIPTNAAVAFEIGDRVDLLLTSTGSLEITGASGVTVAAEGSITTISSQWTRVTLIKRATNDWVVTGGSGEVQTAEIEDGAITEAKLASDSVTSAKILNETIMNIDISPSASIAHSKLANATAGQVLLGTTTTGVVTATTVSGDVTITGAGVTALGTNLSLTGTTKIEEIFEKSIINTTTHPSTGSPLTLDIADGAVYYYTTPCPHTFTLDITATGMVVNQALTLVFAMTSSATTGKVGLIKVNNTTPASVKWFGGNQYPAGSGGNAVDVYTITIFKYAVSGVDYFHVFASQSKFA